MQILQRFNTSRTLSLAAVFISSLLAVLLIWMPFGFGMTGHIEEWDLLGLFNTIGPLPVALPDGPMALHAARPLMPLMFYIAYMLSPDSFVAWHLLLITALVIKGGSSAYLALRATGSRSWASVCGPLVLLYPADTMQLSFRSLHINWAMALALLACSILLYAAARARSVERFLWAALAGVSYFIAACMYEAALTLALLPLLAIMAHDGIAGLGRWLRRNIWPLSVMLTGPVCYLLYVLLVASRVNTYQGSITGNSHHLTGLLIESLPKLFTIGYSRALVGGWLDSIRIIHAEFISYTYLAGAVLSLAVVIGFVAYRTRAASAPASIPSAWAAWRLFLAGLLASGMGYAPFLLLPTHQLLSQRTYLWATPGAALAWLALLILASRLNRILGAALTLVLLTAGIGTQLFQFHHYANISETQQALLRAITENYDGRPGAKNLLIKDESNLLGSTWALLPGGLNSSLAYLYGHPMPEIEVCHFPSGEWQHVNDVGRKGTCTQDAHGNWVLSEADSVTGPGYVPVPRKTDRHMAAVQTAVLTIHPDFTGSIDSGSNSGITPPKMQSGTLGRRYRGALGTQLSTQWPLFRDQVSSHSYAWSFGDWWSMDIPARSSGWREAEWNAEGLFAHRSVSWKTAETARLYFPLEPSAGTYRLRGLFSAFASDAVRANTSVLINHHAVTMRLTDQNDFEADIPAAWLVKGMNEFAVSAPVNHEFYGLSLQLDWFELQPR